jgi:hypothetical protein
MLLRGIHCGKRVERGVYILLELAIVKSSMRKTKKKTNVSHDQSSHKSHSLLLYASGTSCVGWAEVEPPGLGIVASDDADDVSSCSTRRNQNSGVRKLPISFSRPTVAIHRHKE